MPAHSRPKDGVAALAFVLIFKASGVFNFAQGSMVLLAGLALVRSLDWLVAKGFPVWSAIVIGLLFAGVIMAITAFLVERYVLGPLVNQDGLILFMSTIGVTFMIEGGSQMMFGSDVYPLALFPNDAWFLFDKTFDGGILVSKIDVWGGVIAGAGEKLAEAYLGPFIGGGIEYWFAYVLALIVLMARPQGLFGERIIERI